MKKNYLLKTKTYFFYIIYTFILILNRHHYYLIIIDTHRNVCKKDILKLERILNYNAFKQISEKTYIGNLDNNEILILKEKISKIPDENGFIIIIPICGACYNKITYFGNYLIIIDTHRNVCSLEISSEDGNELKNIKFSFDKKFKENLKNNIEETIHVILNRIIEYNPIEDNEKVTYKLKQII